MSNVFSGLAVSSVKFRLLPKPTQDDNVNIWYWKCTCYRTFKTFNSWQCLSSTENDTVFWHIFQHFHAKIKMIKFLIIFFLKALNLLHLKRRIEGVKKTSTEKLEKERNILVIMKKILYLISLFCFLFNFCFWLLHSVKIYFLFGQPTLWTFEGSSVYGVIQPLIQDTTLNVKDAKNMKFQRPHPCTKGERINLRKCLKNWNSLKLVIIIMNERNKLIFYLYSFFVFS